jgi:RHS repeat-associated protein
MAYDGNLSNGIGDGSITGKSDIGIYSYGGAGPHAVSSINTTPGASGGCTLSSCRVDGISNPNFYYDADGNMLCVTTKSECTDGLAARTYSWTSFDMAETIVNGSTTTGFGYTPEHQRGAMGAASGTLYYFSNPATGVFEELAQDGVTWHTYLAPDGHIAAEVFSSSRTISQVYYFAADHLGSTVSLTDTSGAQDEYDSYDAWGLRRQPSGADQPTGCPAIHPVSRTLRGFTGEEEMDNLCLVNLNARLYDPALGRMLSTDPVIGQPQNGQAYNRYSYVVNNPASLTDPTGNCLCYFDVTMQSQFRCVDGCGQAITGQSADEDPQNAGAASAGADELGGGAYGVYAGADNSDGSGSGGFMQYSNADWAQYGPSEAGSGTESFSGDVETVVVTGQLQQGAGLNFGGPSYLDGPVGSWGTGGDILEHLFEGQKMSVAALIWAEKTKDASVALDVYSLMESSTYGVIALNQFAQAGFDIANGAPAGSTLTGAVLNSSAIVGGGYLSGLAGGALFIFIFGEAAEPFGGGVFALGGAYAVEKSLPSNQTVGTAYFNSLDSYYEAEAFGMGPPY